MRRIIYALTLSFLSTVTVAQVVNRTFSLYEKSYILTVDQQPDGIKKTTVKRSDGSAFINPVSLNPFTYSQFQTALEEPLFNDLITKHPDTSKVREDIVAQTRLLFFDAVANLLISPDEVGPVAGIAMIYPTVFYYKSENKFISKEKERRLSRKLENLRIDSLKDAKTQQPEVRFKDNRNPTIHITRSAFRRNTKIQYLWSMLYPINNRYKDSSIVKNVQIEVLEGFLENISAVIDYKDTTRIFTNQFGIGFASKNNISNFHNYWLSEKGKPYDKALKVNLSDLLDYQIHHEPGRRDYSPKDGRYFFDATNKPLPLMKDATKRLLEARVYSDFVGLDEKNPNGLVQIEVAKRINTNTNRGLAFRKQWWFNDAFRFVLGNGVGMLQYVTPVVTLSKFEQHNRNLLVRHNRDSIDFLATTHPMATTVNGKPTTRDTTLYTPFSKGQYLTALELIRYQNFSAGLDFNLLYSENVGGKFNFYIDGGIRFGRTAVRDSLTKINSFTNAFGGTERQAVTTGQVNDFGVNSFQIYPEIRMQWLPDERFGVTLTRRWTYFTLLNGDLEARDLNQASSNNYASTTRPPDFNKSTHWLGTWELSAFLKASDNGRLFFRYRLFNELGNTKYNFYQAQVGYSFYLLGSHKTNQNSSSN